MQITTNVEYLLNEWGKWSRTGLGLTLNSPGKFVYVDIDDELALQIDMAVASLGHSAPMTQKVIMMHYRSQLTYRAIASNLRIGETKSRQLLLSGTAWLDGHLMAKGIIVSKAA